jgi:MFS family permease
MHVALLVAVGLAVAAALRSTWSPCGLSMLSTITPMAERGRGHRFGATASWYLAGAVIGGLTLGGLMAVLALAVRALAVGERALAVTALVGTIVVVCSDTGIGGFSLPVHRRQVNERWLDQYRPWVYGAGFGWQIGTGLSTYIMTSAVYLLVLLAALSGDPTTAMLLGVLFGTVRGLAVFLGAAITDPDALRAFHGRFIAVGAGVAVATVLVEVLAAVSLAWVLAPWVALLVTVGALLCVNPGRIGQRAPVENDSTVAAG